MKPEWKDAPEWAKYLAMDEDGTWWWYEFEPKLGNGDIWLYPDDGRMDEAEFTMKEYAWKETLEARP
jgi:hypothetical protein